MIKSSHGGDLMLDEILKHRVISFVGSGGKTTLMFAVARKLATFRKKVIITTSTKIYIPADYPVALPDKDDINNIDNQIDSIGLKEIMSPKIAFLLNKHNICVTGFPCPSKCNFEPKKICSYELCGFSISDFVELADFVLIEADGSKHMPLKFPGENEPVIPAQTDLVIAVTAMWCVGRPISEVCHRYELACRFLSLRYGETIESDHLVTKEDIIRILYSKQGYRKNVGSRAFLTYIFNNEYDYTDFDI